jgi:hypothetical protein
MRLEFEILGLCIAVPAIVATAMVWLGRRLLPAESVINYIEPHALAAAFLLSYILLPDWAELAPQRHWHYLPYLGVLAAIASTNASSRIAFKPLAWLLYLALALCASVVLVPTWTNLEPSRPISITLLTAYLTLLMVLLDALPDRLLGPRASALLAAAALALAILLLVEFSIKFGQLGLITAAGLAGVWTATAWHWRLASASGSARGLVPVFAVLLGGLAYVGCIDPQPPQAALLAIPAAPLALWLCAVGPLSRLRGIPAAFAQSSVVLLAIVAAALCIILGIE